MESGISISLVAGPAHGSGALPPNKWIQLTIQLAADPGR